MTSRRFCLAGLPFELFAEEGTLPPLSSAYAPFLMSAIPPDEPFGRYRIVPLDHALGEESPADPVWSCDTWRMCRRADGVHRIELETLPHHRWLPVAEISSDFSRGVIRAAAGRRGLPAAHALNYPVDQAVLTRRLLEAGAVVLHACGLVWRGRGLVFCGRSGVGKTTMARMWRAAGATLLNDDRVILRAVGGRVDVSATPWHGEEPEIGPGLHPVSGIFHLSQAPAHAVRPLGAALACARMLATSVAPFYDKGCVAQLAAAAETITQSVPSWDLAFAPQPSVIAARRFAPRRSKAPA